MSIKYYKLEGYKPYWTIDEEVICWDDIETIVSEEGAKWVETKNYEWKDLNNLLCRGTDETLADYIKVDVNGVNYYYYLGDKTSVLALKDNKTYYSGIYILDKYQTIYIKKLKWIFNKNPNTYVLRGFDNRWYLRDDVGMNYTIDFVKQRYLSNSLPTRNGMMIRELAYYTSPGTLWTLNFDDVDKPSAIQFNNISGSGVYEIPFNLFETTNTRGRFEYIIAKPTSIVNSSNSKTRPSNTKQKYYIIPLISGYQNDILKALNDFDIEGEHTYIMDPWGDNQMGLFECDIPFSMWYGWRAKDLYGIECKYIEQPMNKDGSTTIKIPYFEVNNNAPIKLKIIDYSNYNVGFAGKFTYMIENISSWNPNTEPALFAPQYYKEVYNNGASNLISDASYFTFNWSKDNIVETGVECYVSPQDKLNIAYNYGTNTNTALPTLDNTESINNDISLSNLYFGSASANYFTNNATTTNTSIAVRKSEQTQAYVDAAMDTARAAVSTIPSSPIKSFFRGGADITKAVLNAAITTVKVWTDTTLSQQRANAQLRSQINNLTSSPAPLLSNPSTKGIIPNKLGLFETYSIHLHPADEKIVFMDLTHNGYIVNDVRKFQDIFNRKYMNVIYLDTIYFKDDLLKILSDNNDITFNTKSWNLDFLAWLNEIHRIYYPHYFINCVDYTQDDYVDNIEKVIPDFPVHKTNISLLLTNFPEYCENWNETILEKLKEANPDAPEDIWDYVYIGGHNKYGFYVRTKENDKYTGTMFVETTLYCGHFYYNNEIHYFYDFDWYVPNVKRFETNGTSVWPFEVKDIKPTIYVGDTIVSSIDNISFNENNNDELSLPIWFGLGINNEKLVIPEWITITKGFMVQYWNKNTSPTNTIDIEINTNKFETDGVWETGTLYDSNAISYIEGLKTVCTTLVESYSQTNTPIQPKVENSYIFNITGTYADEFKSKYKTKSNDNLYFREKGGILDNPSFWYGIFRRYE